MLNEKQTDTVGWKKRLEDLDSLPGEEQSGKHAAWENLHNRLHKAPRNKKAVWYWAAACLLLLAALPFLIRKTTTALPLKDLVHQKQSPAPAAPVATINAAKPTRITLMPTVKKTARSTAIKRSGQYSTKDAAHRQDVIAITALQPDTVTNQTDGDSAGKAIALAATATVKKKLPVVHINELGKQEQENAKFASHNSWPSLQIKFLNQDNRPGMSMLPVNTEQDMLKIKVPLKN